MPYTVNTDLPVSIRENLPDHAQDIYRKAFNNALAQYDDEVQAFKVAWAAVKKVYVKNEQGKWVKK